MRVPPQIRKRLDNLADEAITRAQEMIKANPEINPTLAYKLAFTWQLEHALIMAYLAGYRAGRDKPLAATILTLMMFICVLALYLVPTGNICYYLTCLPRF